jgi:signal transduction histidine kinase
LNVDSYKAAADALAACRNAIAELFTFQHFKAYPELELRNGPAGREMLREDAKHHLSSLEQAVAWASPSLFADYVEWARTVLASRGSTQRDLASHLTGLLVSVRERLAPEHMQAVDAVSTPALARLSDDAPSCERPHAGRFVFALRTQGPDAGLRFVRELMASGFTLADVYLDVLQASQNEIGRLWQLNKITVAEERYCSAATQVVMAQLRPQVFGPSGNRPAVVIGCVSGELHETGVRRVCDVLQLESFNAFFLGAHLPTHDLVDFVAEKQARVVGLSATVAPQLGRLEAAIRALREDPRTTSAQIVVAGYPFLRVPNLWKSMGADACATDARDMVEVAKRLLRETMGGSPSVRIDQQVSELNDRLVTAQGALEKTNAELKRAGADRAKLAAVAAHDMRTPLSVVMLCAEALMKLLPPPSGSDAAGLTAAISKNARRMRALIDDLMHAYAEDIYAPELALQPMSLEDLARSNTETNRVLAAQKQILLQLRSSGAIPPVLGDPARLEQVLDNLIHNAIKFSPRGSTIRVDVFSEATHAGIAVKDQGVGLDRIQLEALLTGSPLLHQVGTESEPGFGLGFAIIRAIVDKHGGTISGASVPGNGTTFSIRLPAQRAT